MATNQKATKMQPIISGVGGDESGAFDYGGADYSGGGGDYGGGGDCIGGE